MQMEVRCSKHGVGLSCLADSTRVRARASKSLLKVQATSCKLEEKVPIAENCLLQFQTEATCQYLGVQKFSKVTQGPCVCTEFSICDVARGVTYKAFQRILVRERRSGQIEKTAAIAFDGAEDTFMLESRPVLQPDCKTGTQ
jgi:hypothetical protein